MKNIDGKKLLVLIGVILVVAVIIFIIIKGINSSGITDEDKKQAEEYALTYFVNLTENYKTPYNGIDKLFQSDEITYNDLSASSIINTSIKYINNSNIDASVDKTILGIINNTNDISNLDEYTIYNGEAIRSAVTTLFGNVNYNNLSATNTINYLYDFVYNSKYDIYLMKKNNVESIASEYQSVEFSTISTKIKDKKIVTTIAIAYVYDDGANQIYAQDKNGTNVIIENVDEFPTDKIDEFDKFEITSTKTEEGNIVFESIKKVK